MPRRHDEESHEGIHATVTSANPDLVVWRTMLALGAWNPSSTPGSAVSMSTRTVPPHGWVLRALGALTIVALPWVWRRTYRTERLDLVAIASRDAPGRTHVFVESSLSGRAGARVARLLADLPACRPARATGSG